MKQSLLGSDQDTDDDDSDNANQSDSSLNLSEHSHKSDEFIPDWKAPEPHKMFSLWQTVLWSIICMTYAMTHLYITRTEQSNITHTALVSIAIVSFLVIIVVYIASTVHTLCHWCCFCRCACCIGLCSLINKCQCCQCIPQQYTVSVNLTAISVKIVQKYSLNYESVIASIRCVIFWFAVVWSAMLLAMGYFIHIDPSQDHINTKFDFRRFLVSAAMFLASYTVLPFVKLCQFFTLDLMTLNLAMIEKTEIHLELLLQLALSHLATLRIFSCIGFTSMFFFLLDDSHHYISAALIFSALLLLFMGLFIPQLQDTYIFIQDWLIERSIERGQLISTRDNLYQTQNKRDSVKVAVEALQKDYSPHSRSQPVALLSTPSSNDVQLLPPAIDPLQLDNDEITTNAIGRYVKIAKNRKFLCCGVGRFWQKYRFVAQQSMVIFIAGMLIIVNAFEIPNDSNHELKYNSYAVGIACLLVIQATYTLITTYYQKKSASSYGFGRQRCCAMCCGSDDPNNSRKNSYFYALALMQMQPNSPNPISPHTVSYSPFGSMDSWTTGGHLSMLDRCKNRLSLCCGIFCCCITLGMCSWQKCINCNAFFNDAYFRGISFVLSILFLLMPVLIWTSDIVFIEDHDHSTTDEAEENYGASILDWFYFLLIFLVLLMIAFLTFSHRLFFLYRRVQSTATAAANNNDSTAAVANTNDSNRIRGGDESVDALINRRTNMRYLKYFGISYSLSYLVSIGASLAIIIQSIILSFDNSVSTKSWAVLTYTQMGWLLPVFWYHNEVVRWGKCLIIFDTSTAVALSSKAERQKIGTTNGVSLVANTKSKSDSGYRNLSDAPSNVTMIHYRFNYATPIQNVRYYHPIVLMSCLISFGFELYSLCKHSQHFTTAHWFGGLFELVFPFAMFVITALSMGAVGYSHLQ